MGGATAPVSSSGSAPAWTASVSKESSGASCIAASWHPGRQDATVQPSSSKTSSSPSMSSIWTPVCRKPSPRMTASDATLSGATDARKPVNTLLAGRPVEERPDDLAGNALAPVCRLDAVSHLDPAVGVGRRVEAGRADDAPGPIGPGEDDRPAQPRLGRRVDLEIGDPELEEVVELVGQVRRARSRRSRPRRCRGPGQAEGA